MLAGEEDRAGSVLSEALAAVREGWEPESTANNLRMIREARERRGEDVPWARGIEDALLKRARALGAGH